VRRLPLLAAGHGCVDMCQGAVPAMIPFLIAQRGLSFASSTGLLLAMTVSSSVLQPLFGALADNRPRRWSMPIALCVAGAGITVCGVVSGYVTMLAAVALGGLGVAAYHPEAAHHARAAGRGTATAMSWFSVGGNAGFALAPAAITPAVLLAGLPGAGVVLLPILACATLLALHPPGLHPDGPPASDASATAVDDRWGPFSRLAGIAVLRTGVYFGLQAFLASYFIERLDASKPVANAALMLMLAGGACGTLVGGRLGDRVDRRLVLGGFMVAVPALLALMLAIDDTVVDLALVTLIGFATVGNFSVTVVMGQEYLPSRTALAAGVMLGLAIGVGGLIAAALGPVADRLGVETVLWLLALLPLPAAVLAATLPVALRPGDDQQHDREHAGQPDEHRVRDQDRAQQPVGA
jgi:FSR family fosmidomycin resistance protein-like MFS transporter